MSSVFTGFVPAMFLLGPMGAGVPQAIHVILIGLLGMTGWLWVRLPFTGVIVSGDVVTATSWWSRRRLHRGSIRMFRSRPYEGPFFYLAWTIVDGALASRDVEVELKDGTTTVLRGTVCNSRVSFDMVHALNAWLDEEGDAESSPLRRHRRTRSAKNDEHKRSPA
ncbi:hypothetical protein ACFY5A_10190 [Microbacterium sp. NPDC012755]|uniref:hypothetical protein n=1 Tax=Microbacterium sp. NPDC012755 TaxID=3364184 RepID=UPI00367C8739